MPKYVLLNNIEHKDLRVKPGYSAAYGDSVASTLTFPSEFGDIHKEYPILFQRSQETGSYQAIALLGLKKGENLFLSEGDGVWNANYVPGIIARGPFLIGFQDQSMQGGSEKEPVIHVDLDSPRVNFEEGELLFREYGGATPYLEKVSNILRGIHTGMAMSEAMFAIFERFELIEPVSIKIELHNGEKYNIEGKFTISEERLLNLDGAALETLNRSGFLQGAFLVLSSLGNIKKLIEIKNSRLSV